jgi:hypothetical protein
LALTAAFGHTQYVTPIAAFKVLPVSSVRNLKAWPGRRPWWPKLFAALILQVRGKAVEEALAKLFGPTAPVMRQF